MTPLSKQGSTSPVSFNSLVSFFSLFLEHVKEDFREQPLIIALILIINSTLFFLCGLCSRLWLSGFLENATENMIASSVMESAAIASILALVCLIGGLVFYRAYYRTVARRIRMYRRLGCRRREAIGIFALENIMMILLSAALGAALDSLIYGFWNSFGPCHPDASAFESYLTPLIFAYALMFFVPAPLVSSFASMISFLRRRF